MASAQRQIANLVQTLGFERQRGIEMHAQIQELTDQLAFDDRKIIRLEKKIRKLSKPPATQEADPKSAPTTADDDDDADSTVSMHSEEKPPAKKAKNPPVKRAKRKVSSQPENVYMYEYNPATRLLELTHQEVLTKREIHWDKRFAELVAYKEAHGNCNVSFSKGGFQSLGLWVESQRKKQKLVLEEGKECGLGLGQIQRLHSIGFLFQKPPRSTGALPFDQRLQQLLEFKAKTGHCNAQLSNDCPQGLANFVREQRKYYAQLRLGKKNCLTQARVDQLNVLGFQWSVHKKRRVKSAKDGEETSESKEDLPPACDSLSFLARAASLASA